jgi:hypothetical protein
MTELLDLALAAHGGLARWRELTRLRVEARPGPRAVRRLRRPHPAQGRAPQGGQDDAPRAGHRAIDIESVTAS